ncbi:MAG: FKBP-type peptidyl-prolyl cis-trans isomerase [Proteobacteria bacterium]|nr:FKBP-type peptidyl-prolyl cis-trans isomerase [Pseudomonadota bacterium]
MAQQIPAPADVAAAPSHALKTDSGISYVIHQTCESGKPVKATDWVKIHYTGWTTDGKMFDSSVPSNVPATFPIDGLIPGMSEALQLGRTGEKIRCWIPEELAYKGVPGAPQGTLVFDFEIIDIVTPDKPAFDPTPDAVNLKNGISYAITKRGSGTELIKPTDIVTIDFTGWHKATQMRFHSSVESGEPLTGPVKALFPGFREVLVNAHEGDELIAWVPQESGVDPRGRQLPGTLVFTVTVHEVKPEPAPIAAPDDVAAPPSNAIFTKTGLASVILQPGTGTKHPTATSRVRVHYTGWTTDGAMFDSSVVRGEPIVFGLNQVIAGWTEGVQLMVEGEKRRFWIPENLAYKGRPGAPAGMLVFDVELIAIV